MRHSNNSWLVTGLIAVLAIVNVVIMLKLYWWDKRKKKKAAATAPPAESAPPASAPATSAPPLLTPPPPPSSPPDKLLSRLAAAVNNLNYEVRSCEVAQWFVNRLAGQAMMQDTLRCPAAHAAFDYKSIAAAVPGSSREQTRRATVQALRRFVKQAVKRACGSDGMVSGAVLAGVIRSASQYCTPPSGQLLALYPLQSRVPLPA